MNYINFVKTTLMMKKTIIFLLSVFYTYQSNSQNCIPTGLVLNSQSQVDSFPIKYPGCHIIEGVFGLSGSSINNVDSLYPIVEIKNSFQILNCPNLNDFEGLKKLKRVEGMLRFSNVSFQNFSAFDSLEYVGISLSIVNNPTFVNFQGLSKLKYIGGNLEISQCNNFTNFVGLSVLDSIGGNLILNKTCSGLENLKKVKGNLEITYPINNLIPLSNLIEVGGMLKIGGLEVVNFQGLHNLQKINSLSLTYNPQLLNIDVFSGITKLKDLYIEGNRKLNNINGLSNITEIKGNFHFSHQTFVPTIISLSPLSNLETFSGDLYLSGDLSDFSVFNEIDTIRSLEIESITNSNMSNIAGFDSLRRIIWGLNIETNNYLTDITGFQNLNSIKDLTVTNNAFLISLSGLDHPVQIQGSMNISNNPIFTGCNIFPICNRFWLNQQQAYNIPLGNGTGCNSLLEMSQNCGIGPDVDSDGVNDFYDNCPNFYNPSQIDCNNNGIGDNCEPQDLDCDNVPDNSDNCPTVFNPFQTDLNENSIGDACEIFPKFGFGTPTPKAEYHFSNGSIYLDNPEKQLILKKDNGECYTLRVTGNAVQAQNIPCPQ